MEQDSPENFLVENWVRIRSHQNQEQPEPQTDDDEALSLSDLATNGSPEENHQEIKRFSDEQNEEDFAFGALSSSNSPENYKMCSADVLFFRGQILPLRHSVTLPMTRTRDITRSASFSRSEPVSVGSSRSSSTRSSTSGSEINGYKLPGNRNQFHSHPSPTPKIRTRSFRHSYPTSSSKWSLLQLGPLKPQEIGLADLRNRSQRSQNMRNEDENVKMKRILSFAGCKCSASVIESTVSSRISMVKQTGLNEKETGLGISKESNVGRRKHAIGHLNG
ncbi:hypothetical protein L1987_71596 [Smallanthus sonchifolius]|uniref:Uncharacterized protein n=1 Tax=Smallanthus sonchifolius TaxID=185202 RepID=A0ACB9ATJ1_9ASTR|nr:hypothetical protein L1987_71596 [Smallanthus sonchifolius]